MRLIDADALRFLPEWKQGVVYQEHINSAPTISTIRAVPIIGAEWETEILDGIPGRRAKIHFCSRCGFCPTYTTPYCPMCGSDMMSQRREDGAHEKA